MAENPKDYFYRRTEIMNDEKLIEEILKAYEGNYQLLLEQARLLKGDNKDTILDEVIDRIENKKVEQENSSNEKAPENKQDSNLRRLAIINDYQKNLEIMNKLVDYLNAINEEQKDTVLNTTDINTLLDKEFFQKEQKAMDLTNQIFDLNTSLSRISVEFFKEFEYFISLNKEMVNNSVTKLNYSSDIIEFISNINRLMGLCYKEIGSLEYDLSVAGENQKKEIKDKINDYYRIIEVLKSIRMRRVIYEKNSNNKFDIDQAFKTASLQSYMNYQKEEQQPVNTPKQESNQEKGSVIISVKQLNFKDSVQKINAIQSSIMSDLNSVTVKIIDTKLVIKYNNQLMEKLKDLKSKLVLITEQQNEEDKKQIELQPGDNEIENVNSLQKAELRLMDENENSIADYDLLSNKDVAEQISHSI